MNSLRAKKEAAVAAARARVEEVQRQLTVENEAREAANEAAEAAQAEYDEQAGVVKRAAGDVRAWQEKLAALKAAGAATDPFKAYAGTPFGTSVTRIAALIKENASKFKVTPIGPLAAHIIVKDFEWAPAVESVCSALHSFLGAFHRRSGSSFC